MLVIFQHARDLKVWSAISRDVEPEFPVDVCSVSECGSFLNFIPGCAMNPMFAAFLFVGEP